MVSEANSDILLWQALKKGDREAFAAIYQQYFTNLYEYGMRISGDKELVKDCIHDLFVKLWSNKNNLGDVKNLKSYLLAALRGTIYNKTARDSKVRPMEIEEGQFFEMTFPAEAKLAEKETLSENSRFLLDALNKISARQKEMIYLRYFEELEYEEIAAVMGISIKGAYKLSARALEALREVLNISKTSLIVLLSLVREELFKL